MDIITINSEITAAITITTTTTIATTNILFITKMQVGLKRKCIN